MFSDFVLLLFLYRISCITSSSGIAELPLCRPWARLTSPPKIQKIHIFEDFWGHVFLINHIGFSLKYVVPKSSTDFFHRKQNVFRKKNHFLCFYHISSPMSESFIAQLLLHRALDQNGVFLTFLAKRRFFLTV